jgi:peptidyl-prolyl cis-trans isomerase B (cyclophilin B)
MRRPLAALAVPVLALALALGACGGDDKSETGKKADAKTAATTTAPAKTTPKPAGGGGEKRCVKVAAPKPKGPQKLSAPTAKLDPDRTYEAVLDTSCGRFTVTLDVKQSPKTSASFVHMSKEGLYDGTIFHRIVPGFVIQGGDPQATGQGGPGYTVVEAPPSDVKYTKGVVAMAKTEIEDPGTSGSQFYVVTADDAQLPPDYALLGKVTAGQDVVERIGLVRTDETNPDPTQRERPLVPVVLRTVTITESKAK